VLASTSQSRARKGLELMFINDSYNVL